MMKKYITLTEKIVGTAKISTIKSHSVVSVQGGFWIAGLATVSGQADFYYAKFNDTGKLLFFKTTGLSTNEGGYAVKLAATPSGGIIITGQSYENSVSAYLGAIVSVDNTGTIKWYRKTASSGNNGVLDAIRAVLVEPNGDVVVAGDAQQYSNLNYSRLLISKLDSNGNKIFNNQINLATTSNQQAHPTDIQSTPLGYILGGWITGSQNPFLALANKNTGKQISAIYMPNASRYSMDKLIFTPSGKVYTFGFTNRNGTPDAFVMAINLATGTILWQKGVTPTTAGGNDYFNYAYLENKTLYMSMQSNGLGGGNIRQGFVAIDTNGNYVSGNSIYLGTRSFVTSNSAMDFSVLKSGGTVFFGQDNGAAGVRLNLAIMSPCSTASCANHTQNYTLFNTNLSISPLVASDYTLGDLSTENPTTTDQSINLNIECRQACVMPKNLLADTALLCSSGSVSVNPVQTATTCTYLWNDNDVNSAKTFTSAGTYYLTTTNSCGSIKDTLVIIPGDVPKSPAFKDTTYCTLGWSLYKNIAQTGCTYIWDNASTKSYRTFTFPGKFWLETTNSCGKRVDTITIRQGAVVIMPTKLKDTGICIGETIIVNITPKPFHSYLWDDGDTNATRSFTYAGMKFLTVSTACEIKYDSFNIVLRKKPVKSPIKDTVFCSRPILYTTNGSQPSCNYLWDDGSNSPIRTFTSEGKWWLTTFNRCGNRSDSIQIFKDTIPVKVLNDDEYFCQGSPLVIKAPQPFTGKFTYTWSNGDKGPETIIPYSTTVSLTTSNLCGTRTDFVNVHSYRCDCDFYVPNAFTPGNADNMNDGWYPRFDCPVKSGYYSIYNRWGECLVDKKPVNEPWDGRTANGDLVPDGVYAYLIHGLYENSVTGTRTFDKFGDITVLSGKKP